MVRAEAITELRGERGWSWASVGNAVGVAYQRAQQMHDQGTRPQGTGPERKDDNWTSVRYPQ